MPLQEAVAPGPQEDIGTSIGKNCPAELSTHEQLAPAATVQRRDFTTRDDDDESPGARRSSQNSGNLPKGARRRLCQGSDSTAGTWLALYVWRGTPTWQTEST
jgi:hypothetical protein